MLFHGAFSCFAAGQYEEAAAWYEEALVKSSDFAGVHPWLAASYGQLDRIEDARRALKRWRALEPNGDPLGNIPVLFAAAGATEVCERYVEGLRKAGWEGSTE